LATIKHSDLSLPPSPPKVIFFILL
jgi:hypothetical protein